MTTLRASLVESCAPAEALARSSALLDAASDGACRLSASVVHGGALVLGARQRAGRVADLAACEASGVTVLRRRTTGAAAMLPSQSIVWTLSLPRVDALFADATLATLLNRNLRLLLKGLLAAGAKAAYFGRDHIVVGHRPAVALGYEVTPDGRVLVEAFAGYDGAAVIPAKRVKEPVALGPCVAASWTPVTLARKVIECAAERASAALVWDEPSRVEPFEPVRDERDPMPEGSAPLATVEVPIGVVEGATGPWFGGDALTATWWLDALAKAVAESSELPAPPVLEGARVEDLLATLGSAP